MQMNDETETPISFNLFIMSIKTFWGISFFLCKEGKIWLQGESLSLPAVRNRGLKNRKIHMLNLLKEDKILIQ